MSELPPPVGFDEDRWHLFIQYLKDCPGNICAVVVPGPAVGDLLPMHLIPALAPIATKMAPLDIEPVQLGTLARELGQHDCVLLVSLEGRRVFDSADQQRSFWESLNFQRERLASGRLRTCLILNSKADEWLIRCADDLREWVRFFRFPDVPQPAGMPTVRDIDTHYDLVTFTDSNQRSEVLRAQFERALAADLPQAELLREYIIPLYFYLVGTDRLDQAEEIWETHLVPQLDKFQAETLLMVLDAKSRWASRAGTQDEYDRWTARFWETAAKFNIPRFVALAAARRGEFFVRQGELDIALHLYRDEALIGFEKLGDVRSRAVTLGKIADVLQARGELDEALRIRREEQLPVYEKLGDVRSRAVTLGKIADVLFARGELDEALRICREEQLPVYEKLGDVRSRAVTLRKIADIKIAQGETEEGLTLLNQAIEIITPLGAIRDVAVFRGIIADVLFARGELDEALRILREELLPVFEKLGDVRSRAVTLGKIADVLFDRGELEEALRIRREEELPVYEKLGDVRSRAVTLGQIADVLFARGELDEALRIRREEELPVYEKLGDVRSRAVTLRKIADIKIAQGETEEGLTLLNQAIEIITPLGAIRDVAVFRGIIADVLEARGELDEALRIRREEELPVYEKLGDVRSRAVTLGKIADVLQTRGELDEALRISREEQLPVFEKLGDVRSLLVGRTNLALILLKRNRRGDRREAGQLLESALCAAEKLKLPEAEQIRQIQRDAGLN